MNGLPQESIRSLSPLLFPFLALWVLFWVVPLFWGLDLALQNPDSGFATADSTKIDYVGLQNFERTLDDPKFHKALSNTFYYVLGSVTCIIPLAFVLAVGLFELPRFYRGTLAFCLLIPSLAYRGLCRNYFISFFMEERVP